MTGVRFPFAAPDPISSMVEHAIDNRATLDRNHHRVPITQGDDHDCRRILAVDQR